MGILPDTQILETWIYSCRLETMKLIISLLVGYCIGACSQSAHPNYAACTDSCNIELADCVTRCGNDSDCQRNCNRAAIYCEEECPCCQADQSASCEFFGQATVIENPTITQLKCTNADDIVTISTKLSWMPQYSKKFARKNMDFTFIKTERSRMKMEM